MEVTQGGFRGLGVETVRNPRLMEARLEANEVPPVSPPALESGPLAGEVYQNVQLLGHLNVSEFARVMAGITAWVSPEQGCNYCHVGENLAADDVYTKVVARRMIEMTWNINSDWESHIGQTGVTCYTCHRGQNIPAYYWSRQPDAPDRGMVGNRAGQNTPSMNVGLTSLPYDPFSRYLEKPQEIRVQSDTALPTGNRRSIKETEGTYGLMVHLSQSLGVNCTHCHNSRAFMPWEESMPARAQAWHAIRMVRHVNDGYIGPLAAVLPPKRLGPAGDAFKANCATCHQGLPKPLGGVAMLADYPELLPPE